MDFFTLTELAYCQHKLGHHNVIIYEAYFYTEGSKIFSKYFGQLNAFKAQYDTFPTHITQDKAKLEAYLKELNGLLGLQDNEALCLTPERLRPNKAMRKTGNWALFVLLLLLNIFFSQGCGQHGAGKAQSE